MIYLIFIISITSSFFIGLALGGRGASRNKMVNLSVAITLITIIVQFFLSVKFGFINLIIDIITLYGIAFFFNKKYHGLDQINSQLDAENYRKHLEELLKKK